MADGTAERVAAGTADAAMRRQNAKLRAAAAWRDYGEPALRRANLPPDTEHRMRRMALEELERAFAGEASG